MKAKIYDNSLPPFPLYPSTVDINYNQSGIARENGYSYDEVFMVKSGSGILTVEGNSYTLEENDMFYLHAGIPHEYHRTGDNFTTSFLSFFGSGVDTIREYYSLGNFGIFKNKNTGSFEAELLRLFEDFDAVYEASTLSAMTYSAVIAFFDEACKKEHTPLEKVYGFLNANYVKPITLDDIISVYPYSKTKLCTDFKKEYGITVFDALTSIRLDHAQLMLRANPYLTLKKIAESTGFGDVSYFCKMYKRKHGHSPKHT